MGVAWDIFASAGTADAALDGRTSSSGHVWAKLAAGFANSLLVRYVDTAIDGTPKRINPAGTQRLNYLPVTMTGRVLRAQARRAVLSTAATARGFLGVGFIDSDGDGYFGGWANDATPKATSIIGRSNGADGTLDVLASWDSALPFAAPFARMMAFELDRETAGLSFYWDGVLIAAVTDLSYAPTLPAVIAHDMAAGTPLDALLDVLYEQTGSFTSSSPALEWHALGVNGWRAEAVVNFAETPTYEIATEAALLAGYARAKTVVFSSFGASGEITVTMDNVPITIQAGAELVLAAPQSGRFTLAGTVGVLNVRLYSTPYDVYQRGG